MKQSLGIFVTGTNTEVGKTMVTRALARAFVNRGKRVAAVKPVESRDDEGPSDTELLLTAARMEVSPKETCAYSFSNPVSPHLASQKEGISIQKEPIYDLVVHWGAKADILLVEGAGGLLVPLSKELLYVDLMVDLNFPVLIVAPNELGAINSKLLTIEAARSRGLDIAGVILNRTEPTGLDNASAIAQHGKVPLLGSLPTVFPLATDDNLAELAETHLDLDCLLIK